MVEENWKIDFIGDSFVEFHVKLKKVRGAFIKWSKGTFGNIFQRISTLEEKVKVKEIQLEINATMENKVSLNKVNVDLKKNNIMRSFENRRQGWDGSQMG